jgi:hypothetical protein
VGVRTLGVIIRIRPYLKHTIFRLSVVAVQAGTAADLGLVVHHGPSVVVAVWVNAVESGLVIFTLDIGGAKEVELIGKFPVAAKLFWCYVPLIMVSDSSEG